MKRLRALFMAALLLFAPPAALGEESTVAEELRGNGFAVMRNHEVSETARQKIAVDYPTFTGENAVLTAYLTEEITAPILALRHLEPMAEEAAYESGHADSVRSGFYASLDFPGLLSVEATVTNTAAGAAMSDVSFLWRVIDLNAMRSVTIPELFSEDAGTVEAAIRQCVYDLTKDKNVLLDTIKEAGDVPLPDSYFLRADYLRVIYAPGALNAQSVTIDLPWDTVSLTRSALLTGDGQAPAAAPEASVTPAVTETPAPAQPSLSPAPAPATPAPQATLDPNFALPPVNTPTPMPLAGNDSIIADVLTHGLWKKLGSDGSTYYQFTQDGKLLTVTVSDFTLNGGDLRSSVINGAVDVGSDSAFTLYRDDGSMEGYVLNRMGEAVAPEEFVTPSPTPVVTPTPVPTATPAPTATPSPTPSPTPAPTPVPTPTLSPYMQAMAVTPMLAPLSDARFARQRDMKVYSAPDETAYRNSRAQVTTDETVVIYGVTDNGWVLVSYEISGSTGRIGYIQDSTLADKEKVARLALGSMEMTLTKDCSGTEDPLLGHKRTCSLKKGDAVTLLAFLDGEWAYVEIRYEDKPCRIFIPQKALQED